jgi:hypothetical protein
MAGTGGEDLLSVWAVMGLLRVVSYMKGNGLCLYFWYCCFLYCNAWVGLLFLTFLKWVEYRFLV